MSRCSGNWGIAIALLITASLNIVSAKASDNEDKQRFISHVCQRLKTAAIIYGLPPGFLARLIWKESRFNPGAISPKGAEGIAQFMPGTAELYKLENPFEPHSAIVAAAQYLSDLHQEFGNLGLAAAGYNAGPGRVAAWLGDRSHMPAETQDFVETITGYSVVDWKKEDLPKPDFRLDKKLDFETACKKFPILFKASGVYAANGDTVPLKAWGVHLAADFSRSKAMNNFKSLQRRFPTVLGNYKPSIRRKINYSFGRKPRHEIQIGTKSRAAGEKLCRNLKKLGGACLVLKN